MPSSTSVSLMSFDALFIRQAARLYDFLQLASIPTSGNLLCSHVLSLELQQRRLSDIVLCRKIRRAAYQPCRETASLCRVYEVGRSCQRSVS